MSDVLSNFIVCTSFNVILIGDSRVGKTTFVELLQTNTTKCINETYRGTVEPEIKTLYYLDNTHEGDLNEKHICLNILDTPGLDEVTKDGDPARPNDELQDIISDHIKSNFSSINLILITVQNSGITDKVLTTIYNIKDYFGGRYLENICLLITHCDDYTEEQENQLVESLKTNREMNSFIKAIKGRVLFTGRNNDYNDSVQTYDFIKKQHRRMLDFIKMLRLSNRINMKNINDLDDIRPIDILESAAATNNVILKMSEVNLRTKNDIESYLVKLTELKLPEDLSSTRNNIINSFKTSLDDVDMTGVTDGEKNDAKRYNEIEIPLKQKASELKQINYHLKTELKRIEGLYNRLALNVIVKQTGTPSKIVRPKPVDDFGGDF